MYICMYLCICSSVKVNDIVVFNVVYSLWLIGCHVATIIDSYILYAPMHLCTLCSYIVGQLLKGTNSMCTCRHC